jgi:4-hydroxybenzoate polyprenyltransferase
MAQSLYLILFASGAVWLYRVQGRAVRALVGNINPERLVHFLVFFALGGGIAFYQGAHIAWTALDFVTITVAVLTIIFTGMFAMVTNDLVDEPIDAISNKDRPLITGAITKDMMRDVLLLTGLMALFGALALGSYTLFWVLIFTAAYYIYSVPPLRLKRVPLLASVFIGIATLAVMLLGFFLVSADRAVTAFPAPFALLVVLFMMFISNVRDLKDIEGDAAAGIRTLPTILGERRSRMVIGAMMFVAYALVPLFIPRLVLWLPSLIAGFLSWTGLVHGKGEKFVFPLYFLYLVSAVLLLVF